MHESQLWAVAELEDDGGAMIFSPPHSYGAMMLKLNQPFTSRRIALLESSAYLTHQECVSFANGIVERHNAQ